MNDAHHRIEADLIDPVSDLTRRDQHVSYANRADLYQHYTDDWALVHQQVEHWTAGTAAISI